MQCTIKVVHYNTDLIINLKNTTMDIIITVFTVLSMYLNLSSNPNSDYCYNADIENGVVNALYVFDNKSDYLTPTYAYQFTYDEAGRLSEKATYNWNKETKTYTNSHTASGARTPKPGNPPTSRWSTSWTTTICAR